MVGGERNAASKEKCCELCYAATGPSTPCIAAVWTTSGHCYLKTDSAKPYFKRAGIQSCVTNRHRATLDLERELASHPKLKTIPPNLAACVASIACACASACT